MPVVEDNDLRDVLAPLRGVEPSDEAVHSVLASVLAETGYGSGRPPRLRSPRHWRLVAALATATAVVAVALTALPGPARDGSQSTSGVEALRIAAATAAAQPEPAAARVFRYTEVLDRWRWSPGELEGRQVDGPLEIEQRIETWVRHDDWTGRLRAHRGRVTEGEIEIASPRVCDGDLSPGERPVPAPAECALYPYVAPADGEYGYGGRGEVAGAIDVDVAELPTDAKALRRTLLDAYRSINWAPGRPTPVQARYDLIREVLALLQSADTPPDLRAALWGVLALSPWVEVAPTARDPLGRGGEAVTIPTRQGGGGSAFTIIFDPHTSELLFWSEHRTGGGRAPNHESIVLRTGRVDTTSERPRA